MSHQHPSLKSIGLFGAITILVGFVVSASIFVLPGGLASSAGPGLFLSFLLAAVPAIFCCIVAAQVAGFFPVSGASYVAISKMISPRVGFLCMWLLIAGATIGIALLAIGAAQYLRSLFPQLNLTLTAVLLIVILCSMNLASTRLATSSQEIMVVIFIAAIGLFCFSGISQIEPNNLDPLLPNGIGGVVAAAIPAFFAYVGFMVIVDLGGEVREPSKNIPRALALSFVIVLTLYTVFGITLVGVLPWKELAHIDAPVSIAAAKILPPWAVTFITLSTVFAAASTINGIVLGYSRDIHAMAVEGTLPRILAGASKADDSRSTTLENVSPRGSITLLGVVAIAIVLLGGNINEYAIFVVLAALLVQICLAISVWRVPSHAPDIYQSAQFKMSKVKLYISSGALIVVSIIFFSLGVSQDVKVGLLAIGYGFIGFIFYSYRARKILSSPSIPTNKAPAS